LRETSLLVYATHRSPDLNVVRDRMLSGLPSSVDSSRLTLLPLELTEEESIASAADSLAKNLPSGAHLHAAWITGGTLHPEKRPQDIEASSLLETFKVNVISHLLMIKHFSRFLPEYRHDTQLSNNLSKWVHVSARVGSISDNQRGGWYSYRSSKAALNQVIKTFDLQLQMQKKKGSSIAVGVHPGTVKTDLSKNFWGGVPDLFEPDAAAQKLVNVVENLREGDRGKVWDWAGKQVPW
jgi:NAD(P)-dependent dehydrogenase (short-subunit alcohol dehydrogenase family)